MRGTVNLASDPIPGERSEKIIANLAKHDSSFLRWALEHYSGNVITFDYPTLSQQAIASAMSLHRQIKAHVRAPVDVISHSQGGLVTRFWLEGFDPERLQETRAVFVAGALGGTSLAAPTALRRALQGLANFAWVLGKGSGLLGTTLPLFGVVSGMFALLEKSVKLVSGTPVLDAGIAMVPGLSGMPQVATNAELRELQAAVTSVPEGYFAVTGDFEPTESGWQFWKRIISRTQDSASDLLFRAPNDMVVDTASMTHLADGRSIPNERVHHFRAGESHVHHNNYFEQESTARALRRWLGE